jgi:hypothetical protein
VNASLTNTGSLSGLSSKGLNPNTKPLLFLSYLLGILEVRPAGFEPATRGLEERSEHVSPSVVPYHKSRLCRTFVS